MNTGKTNGGRHDIEDYLWDPHTRSDEARVDPEIAHLEQVLAPLRYRNDDPGEFVATGDDATERVHSRRFSIVHHRRTLAAAASIAAVLMLALISWRLTSTGAPAGSSMRITTLVGSPSVDSQAISRAMRLEEGDWIETDAQSRARIEIESLGHVELGENSRVRITSNRANEQRLAMARGRLDAVIDAPPRLFIVDTPATTAVDLGCVYTLIVNEDGEGLLEVDYGWVSLETGNRIALVPSEARCRIRKGAGPGTPHFPDASDAFIQSIMVADETGLDEQALVTLIDEARARDTLSLWNLIPATDDIETRVRLIKRIRQFVDVPDGVDQRALLHADRDALEKWRKVLSELW